MLNSTLHTDVSVNTRNGSVSKIFQSQKLFLIAWIKAVPPTYIKFPYPAKNQKIRKSSKLLLYYHIEISGGIVATKMK